MAKPDTARTRYCLLDVESQSRADLRRIGGRKYWLHESTRVLVVVLFFVDRRELVVWHEGDAQPDLDGYTLVAHNATHFDRFAIARLGWRGFDGWVDSANLARKQGLPGALDQLGTRVLGIPKDVVGSRFTRGLSTVRRPSGKGPDAVPPEVWRSYTAAEKRERGVLPLVSATAQSIVDGYCVSDVEIIARAWREHLEPWIALDAAAERVDVRVNDRGIRFDVDLARALLRCDARLSHAALADVAAELDWSVDEVRAAATSPAKFCAVTGAPDARKTTVATLDHPLARARRARASIARGKLEAGLAREIGGRLYDAHNYCAAHTWRWSSNGMMLHNMPRPSKRFEDWGDGEICVLADSVLEGSHYADAEEIDLLLRACLVADEGCLLAVADFSGVEARGLAWASGDREAIGVFERGEDPYIATAADVFECPLDAVDDSRRKVGKMGELACGYGMAAETLALQAGIDLQLAERVVRVWRKKHAPSVRFWYALEAAFIDAINGRATTVGAFTLTPCEDPAHVAMVLPNGRPLIYRNARMDRTPRTGRWAPCYHGRGVLAEFLYGGKLAENAIQSLCRELLAEALVRLDDAGFALCLHVHDEPVANVPREGAAHALAKMMRIMLEPYWWAPGLPLAAKGFTAERYRK